MKEIQLLRLGGICAMVFSVVWIVNATIYLIVAGIPAVPPSIQETVEIMRQPAYRLAFWLWPLAYLSVIVTALATHQYLRFEHPVLAKIGCAFLLLYAVLWFVFHGVIMAAISVAQMEPVDESQLSGFLILVGTLGSPLFWAIAIFEATWGAALLQRQGTDRVAGWAFVLGSISSVLYFVMRYTGPFRPAELVHEFLILFMIIGIGSLGFSLLRAGENHSDSSMSV